MINHDDNKQVIPKSLKVTAWILMVMGCLWMISSLIELQSIFIKSKIKIEIIELLSYIFKLISGGLLLWSGRGLIKQKLAARNIASGILILNTIISSIEFTTIYTGGHGTIVSYFMSFLIMAGFNAIFIYFMFRKESTVVLK
jgi:hypothetical protein